MNTGRRTSRFGAEPPKDEKKRAAGACCAATARPNLIESILCDVEIDTLPQLLARLEMRHVFFGDLHFLA